MAKNIFIQDALTLVQNDQDNAVQALLSLIQEKGFLLKEETINKKQSDPQHVENPEFTVKTLSHYYYNENKEALCLHIDHSTNGTYAINMEDYKNRKRFSAYKFLPETQLPNHCYKKLEPIPSHKIEKADLKYSYGFDFTR